MAVCYEEGHLVVVFSTDHGLLEGGSVDAKLGHLCWLQLLLYRKLVPRTLGDLKQRSCGTPPPEECGTSYRAEEERPHGDRGRVRYAVSSITVMAM